MRMEHEARMLGKVDVAPLHAYVEERGQEVWHFHCDMPALRACDRIILRHSRDYDFDFDDIVDWELMGDFAPYVQPIADQVCGMLGKNRIVALFIANLPPQEFIYPHVDRGKFLEVPSRVHVPIKTNPDVTYYIGGAYVDVDDGDRMARQVFAKEVQMAAGEVWEIDNLSYHSVANRGATDRWHLILNIW